MARKNFWEGYVRPGRIFGNLYFVGTHPASTHLVDTGDGLLIIDPGFPEALAQILENIRALGFDPMEIRVILLSHGHYDHAGAAQELAEMTGARIYVGAGDLDMVSGKEDSSLAEIFGVSYTQGFTPHGLLRDEDTVTLGNTRVRCLSTPGHTAGTTSFFFDVTDGKRVYRAGMHGGVGLNTLKGAFMRRRGIPESMRDEYVRSLERLRGERVAVFLGNHVGNNDTEGKLERVRNGAADAFVAPEEWLDFLERCKKNMELLIETEAKMEETVQEILQNKIVLIVRGLSDEELITVAEAAWRGGIRVMECTYDAAEKTPDEVIARRIGMLATQFEGRMLIGAGTVIRPGQVELTKRAGGRFIVSPDTNEEIIRATKKAGLVSIPGALTPSEATAAHRAGADFVKLFPINAMEAGYLKALCAPLSHIRFLAVGGVRGENMAEYAQSGACGFGIGLTAEDRQALSEGCPERIEERLRELVLRATGGGV